MIAGIALVVIAVACAVGVVILWKSKGRENSGDEYEGEHSMAALKFSEIEFDTDESISLNNRYKIYPPDYSPPHMREALLNAKIGPEDADYIVEACKASASHARNDGLLTKDFTEEEDAEVIAMYTFDFGPENYEMNPYRMVNRELIGRNTKTLMEVKDLLYLVMHALRKLPRVTGQTLYRGVRVAMNLDTDHYSEGNVVTWPALSSTSPDSRNIKTFLSKGGGKVKGTMFIIENGWGYNIQPYSLFPDEAEILLEPERQFMVKSVIEAEGIIVITLEMLDSPLILPNVFGKGLTSKKKKKKSTNKKSEKRKSGN